MLVGKLRHFTPTGSAFQETFFYQERFIDFPLSYLHLQKAVAMVVNPTGPPLNLSMMVQSILLSISSRPYLSIFRASRANCAISVSMLPEPFTWAKSRTRRSNALAIRGVPRLRARNLGGSPYGARHIEDAGRTTDNAAQHIIIVIFQMQVDTETGTQRSCQQTATRGSSHQRERIQINLYASGRRAFVYHDVYAVVLHG